MNFTFEEMTDVVRAIFWRQKYSLGLSDAQTDGDSEDLREKLAKVYAEAPEIKEQIIALMKILER